MTSTLSNNKNKLERAQSGTARAALLGISDGLITNVALIQGIAASGVDSRTVQLAGIASLIAGAFSMAVGEYISMQGQVDLLKSILEAERRQLQTDAAAAHKILESIMIDDGMKRSTAHTAAEEIGRHPEKAMALYARGKLGLNPNELGSPWSAAASSFLMFTVGAFVPLLPWLVSSGTQAIAWSIGLSAVAALGIGAYLGSSTDGRWIRAAIKQLLAIVLAAGCTYAIGHLFGAPNL